MQLPYSSSLTIYSGKGTQPATICEDKSILCRLKDSKITDTEHLNKLHCYLWNKIKLIFKVIVRDSFPTQILPLTPNIIFGFCNKLWN